MVPPTRRQVVVGVVATLLLLAAIGGIMRQQARGQQSAGVPVLRTVARGDAGPAQRLVVDVAGAVRKPGVYELADGARVREAIASAGGALPEADLGAVNRAAPLVDGQQVLVPAAPEAGVAGTGSGAVASTGSGRAATAPSAPGTAPRGTPVSLNSADAAAFDTLEGIGPTTAQRIVEDRSRNGPFRTVEDLDRVPGIGPATIESLRSQVTL